MQVMFLNCSFIDIVQKLIRLMTLTVNLNVLTKLFNKLSKKITNSKWVVQLSHISKDLTKKLKKKYQFVWLASSNDSLLKKKKEVNAVLHYEKTNCQNQMLKKAWKRHFQHADTATLKAQFVNLSFTVFNEDIKPLTPL